MSEYDEQVASATISDPQFQRDEAARLAALQHPCYICRRPPGSGHKMDCPNR